MLLKPKCLNENPFHSTFSDDFIFFSWMLARRPLKIASAAERVCRERELEQFSTSKQHTSAKRHWQRYCPFRKDTAAHQSHKFQYKHNREVRPHCQSPYCVEISVKELEFSSKENPTQPHATLLQRECQWSFYFWCRGITQCRCLLCARHIGRNSVERWRRALDHYEHHRFGMGFKLLPHRGSHTPQACNAEATCEHTSGKPMGNVPLEKLM